MLEKMYSRSVTIWLFICALLILVMVTLGGLTRLTGSGLSMTGWEPITGWLPPLTAEQWQQEFTAYQASPEFKQVNSHLDVEGFKSIFWLEFIHRLVGRLAGCFVLFPLAYFVFSKQIDKKFTALVSGIFLLGGIQGFVGWYMVKTGLRDIPYVNHLWLAGHLLMASLIFALLLKCAFYSSGFAKYRLPVPGPLKYLCRLLPYVVLIQIGLGALVAGLDAGLVYNSFPTMDGQIIPDGLLFLQPWYQNLVDNVTMVQFQHRMGAFLVVACVLIFAAMKHRYNIQYSVFKKAGAALVWVTFIQFGLGVGTLLLHVPIGLASMHQVMALILFAITLFVNYIV
jgi:heme a synthase